MGHNYEGKVDLHASQTDSKKGFGGKFGVQSDRVDKVSSAVSDLGQTDASLAPNETNLALLRSVFSTFWLTERHI